MKYRITFLPIWTQQHELIQGEEQIEVVGDSIQIVAGLKDDYIQISDRLKRPTFFCSSALVKFVHVVVSNVSLEVLRNENG